VTYNERYVEAHRDDIINVLVNSFINDLTIEDALAYIVNDMIERYDSMTNAELIAELED
jgi:hypothetical protein